MAHERQKRNVKKRKVHKPPVISIEPSRRAHLAQKSLFDSNGKPTGMEVALPSLPTPLPKDILYYGPEPDFQVVYFSLYDKLALHCYAAEKTGQFDAITIKLEATACLDTIKKTMSFTNNTNILSVYSHLAQLISDHLISPQKLKLKHLKHLKHFLGKKTHSQQDILDEEGYLSPVSEAELLPLISDFESLSLYPKPKTPYELFPIPSIEEILRWGTRVTSDRVNSQEDISLLSDIFPADSSSNNDAETPLLKHAKRDLAENTVLKKQDLQENVSSDESSVVTASTSESTFLVAQTQSTSVEIHRTTPSAPTFFTATKKPEIKPSQQTLQYEADDAKLARSMSLGLRTKK